MRFPGRFVFWAISLAMAIGRGGSSPLASCTEPVGDPSSSSGFTFRVSADTVSLAKGPEGYAVEVEGFGVRDKRPGAPDLPFQIVRVAIPRGVVPSLEVRVAREDALPGMVPAPQPSFAVDLDSEAGPSAEKGAAASQPTFRRRAILLPDREIYEGSGLYPRDIAALGEVGVLRAQRYVEVRLSPVRYDPAIRGIRVARAFDVTVLFAGGVVERTAPAAPTRFEPVYRDAFVNYEQGTTFRLDSVSEPSAESAASVGVALEDMPRYRILVSANGPVRLDFTRMATTGFLAYPISSWKLTSHGVEIPLRVHDAGTADVLEAGDWVQFYGQALDFDAETALDTDLPDPEPDLFVARDFTDQNTYFLTIESGERSRMPERDAAPSGGAVAASFEGVVRSEVDDAWRPLGEADFWYWSPTQSYPTYGTGSTALVPLRTVSVTLPGVIGTLSARAIVGLRGITESYDLAPDHRSKVTLRNAESQDLASQSDDGTWDGRTLYTHDFTWTYGGSGSVLTSPAQVAIEALSAGGLTGYYNQFILDFVEIRYGRSFAASGDTLTFDYPDGDAEFEVTGLASGTLDPPDVYEITGRVGETGLVSAVRLTGATIAGTGPYSVRFRVANDPDLPDGTARRFVVAGSGSARVPSDAEFAADTVSDLRSTAIQADLVVIGPSALLDTPEGQVGALMAHRAAQGISSKIARLEDVRDEFSWGLPGPLAIRSFLAWVMSAEPGEGWASPKPSYVLLVGDGSYAYKLGAAGGDYTPTQIVFKDNVQIGYYASDNLLAAVVGDDSLPDLVVGRVPTRSAVETDAVLRKIREYEATPAAGTWVGNALTVSDRGKQDCSTCPINAGESLDFEATNAAAVEFMKSPPHTAQQLRYYSDYCNLTTYKCDSQAMNADIKDGVNGTLDASADGAAMMQYVGHSNFNVWSDDAFFAQGWSGRYDVEDLDNGLRLPWLLAHNCLTGGFHTTMANSMGEDWLKRSGGGAIAVFSPSGLSDSFISWAVSDYVWNELFGPRKEREIGVPVLGSISLLCLQGSIAACQDYVLMGDPATRLAMPSVAPPTGVAAVGADESAELSWAASQTSGATYDVYRTTDPNTAAYAKVNASAIPGATPGSTVLWTDTGLINTATYYYYVVATDTSGYESAWSNFNSDCAVNGPDCVRATPLNPDPPSAPTGLTVVDPETGGKLNLTWAANPETDLRSYSVLWGVDPEDPGIPCPFTGAASAGKLTSYSLSGIENGTRYCIEITATNTSGLTSPTSIDNERTGTPTWVRGLRSPAFIRSLRVDKSGSDAALTWEAVTTDIYGKPTTIAYYEVFRGTAPDFVPDAGTRIGTPAGPSFTDVGAMGSGTPSYHYLVRAVDGDGNVGGLGYQLPNGIDALQVAKSGTVGYLTLSWPAVTVDFDGRPTRISHYDVYAADHPFTRADVRDGTVPKVAGPVAGSAVDVAIAAGSWYYSVLVVDARGNVSAF